MTAIIKTEHFYQWFKNAGGDLVTANPEVLNMNLLNTPLQAGSTLKTDPQRIKEKYNHKFKQNEYQ